MTARSACSETCLTVARPIFEGLYVEGYCGLCNELTATDLRQWFVCPICLNVVLSYPKGFAASRYVHEFWAREITPQFPELVLEELDEVKLEPFVHADGRRRRKPNSFSRWTIESGVVMGTSLSLCSA